ncbi:MAG: glutamate--tRNA ligase, partial [Thermoanaerobaculum sp.]
AFTLDRIVLGGPVFDLTKLTWLNGKYIRNLSPEELLGRLRTDLLGDDYLLTVLPLVRERIDKLEDFIAYASFFFVGEVSYPPEVLPKLVMKKPTAAEAAAILEELLEEELDPLLDWSKDNLEAALRGFAEARGLRAGDFFMAVRVAVTGRTATPPLFETMEVLGKETCRRRLRHAISVLKSAVMEKGA